MGPQQPQQHPHRPRPTLLGKGTNIPNQGQHSDCKCRLYFYFITMHVCISMHVSMIVFRSIILWFINLYVLVNYMRISLHE